MRRSAAILTNSLATASAQAATLVTAFYLLPRVVAAVGQAPFGLWATVGSILMLIGLADSATTTGVVRAVSRTATVDRFAVLGPTLITLGILVTLLHGVVGALLLVLAEYPFVVFGRANVGMLEIQSALLRIGAFCALILRSTLLPVAS